MVEVRLKRRRRSAWPWLLALIAFALVIWAAAELLSSIEPAAAVPRAAPARPAHGESARPAAPREPAPTRDRQREEALRIRSRMMA